MLDASALVAARVTGAKVDMSLAIGFARAHGLLVDLGDED
jgi:hypothetical protein